jgi:hypothetical protein
MIDCCSHKPVDDIYLATGLRILREYMLRKKFDVETCFTRFLQVSGLGQSVGGKMNKKQWREAMKREGLPFNKAQCDFMFEKLDANGDGAMDLQEWLQSMKDDGKLLFTSQCFIYSFEPYTKPERNNNQVATDI